MKAKQSREVKWETKEDESLLKKVMEMASYNNYGHFTATSNNDCLYDNRASVSSSPPTPLSCSCNQPPTRSNYHVSLKEEVPDERVKEKHWRGNSSDEMKRNTSNDDSTASDKDCSDTSGDGSGSENGRASCRDGTAVTGSTGSGASTNTLLPSSRQQPQQHHHQQQQQAGYHPAAQEKTMGLSMSFEGHDGSRNGRVDNLGRDGARSYSQSFPHPSHHFHHHHHHHHSIISPTHDIDLNKVVWLEIAEHMARMKLTSTLRTALECKTR